MKMNPKMKKYEVLRRTKEDFEINAISNLYNDWEDNVVIHFTDSFEDGHGNVIMIFEPEERYLHALDFLERQQERVFTEYFV